MKFIETLSYSKIVELIFEAKNQLLISLPSIDSTIADALIKRATQVVIKVVVDNSEESIRNGYGDVKAIETIIKAGIEINQCDGNLVSFIIADETGYYIFPQSRIFSEEPKGANAVRIDPVTINILNSNYFATDQKVEINSFDNNEAISKSINHFEDAFKELSKEGRSISSDNFNASKFKDIKRKLEINPPLEPDIQRQINTYTAKIQFVELKFAGGGIENTIATLPKKAIPINSEELKNLLLTKIKMFQDLSGNEKYKKFVEFKAKVDKLRKDFLTPITCREGKSIINIELLEDFKKELIELNNEAIKLNDVLPEILEEEKLNTTDLLRKELKEFLTLNEPNEIKTYTNPDTKERKLLDIINIIVVSIKFPDIKKLIEHISLNANFYDLTWNDFSDEKLLQEFSKKEIMEVEDIDSIIELNKAFKTKK
jgi:hypothetical protein